MSSWKLYLWVEGPSDAALSKQSEQDYHDERTSRLRGALPSLIWRSLLELSGHSESVFERVLPQTQIIPKIAREALKERISFGGGKNKNLTGWPLKAFVALDSFLQRERDALVVIVRDRDKTDHPIKQRDELHQELRRTAKDRAAMGVCVRMVEAWLLADQGAFKTLFGSGVKLPGKPEEEEDPKQLLSQLLSKHPDEEKNLIERFAQIAEAIDLKVLSRQCPLGFKEMYEALNEFLAPSLRR